MLEERAARARARADSTVRVYEDPSTAWSDTTFRQLFLFMYDASFYDRDARRYRTAELVERWTTMFGRVDSVLLWHAYPRLGFDSRTQFDFYRDMPGGLAQLRAEVCDVAARARDPRLRRLQPVGRRHATTSSPRSSHALDADGVMLDTMTDVPEAPRARRERAKQRRRLRPRAPADATRTWAMLRQSWAQWFDVGDARRRRSTAIAGSCRGTGSSPSARWDTSRRRDIVYSFFNGSGLILWDNVFGTWNPYSREDRRLIAETAAVFDRYEDSSSTATWLPLDPDRGLRARREPLERGSPTARPRNRDASQPHESAARCTRSPGTRLPG